MSPRIQGRLDDTWEKSDFHGIGRQSGVFAHPSAGYLNRLPPIRSAYGAVHCVLTSMHPPTKPMRTEAVGAGFYESPWGKHPKIQLITVSELLKGKRIDMPPAQGVNVTFKKAGKHKKRNVNNKRLFE